jgi:hypothetical protein
MGMAFFEPFGHAVKRLAVGTRAPRPNLLSKLEKRQPLEFRRLGIVEKAHAARANMSIQRRFWWDVSAVTWMKKNPGKEHEWSGLMSCPGFFDDANAWLSETCSMLEEAADKGWICPESNVARLLAQPEKSDSKQELGDAIAGFDKLGDPWPSKARYCDTLSSMGHKLFADGYAESLSWRSFGALEKIKICQDMESLGGDALPKGRRLRL